MGEGEENREVRGRRGEHEGENSKGGRQGEEWEVVEAETEENMEKGKERAKPRGESGKKGIERMGGEKERDKRGVGKE